MIKSMIDRLIRMLIKFDSYIFLLGKSRKFGIECLVM